jgi:hypothetical protein
MDLAELQRQLIAAARSNPPSEDMPYAFEKRVMAHLRALPAVDDWALWSRALWRAAAPCLGIMLLLSAWSLFAPTANAPAASGAAVDLSQELDNTVLAAANQEQLADITW